MFYMNDEDFILFGASPESALKYAPDNRQLEFIQLRGLAHVVLMRMVILTQNWMHAWN